MSTAEIKSEILQALDKIPEDALKDILGYVKKIEQKSTTELNLLDNLEKVLSENKGLLERLAK